MFFRSKRTHHVSLATGDYVYAVPSKILEPRSYSPTMPPTCRLGNHRSCFVIVMDLLLVSIPHSINIGRGYVF